MVPVNIQASTLFCNNVTIGNHFYMYRVIKHYDALFCSSSHGFLCFLLLFFFVVFSTSEKAINFVHTLF